MSKPIRSVMLLGFVLAAVSPLAAQAAWWNPLTWMTPKEDAPQPVSTGISVSKIPAPTVEELQQRIADLEQQLKDVAAERDAALAKQSQPQPAATAASSASAAPASTSGLSAKAVAAKVSPALVFIQTATSSGSGTLIDAAGHILVDAHTVWSQDPTGAIIGAANQMSVTLASGAQRSAKLVGIDEAHDLAVVQITSGAPSSYLKINYDSGLSKGDTVYVASLPSQNGGSTGGKGFITGAISQKTVDSIEMTSDDKPYDTGGAMVTANGNFIGVPNHSSCKIIEDMSTCLKYTVTENSIVRAVLPKLLAGMKLYKQRTDENPEEVLIKGELQGMYQSVSQGSTIDFAVAAVSGNNSFDLFNSKLGSDTDGKIAKLYVLKLKQIADSMYQAVDFLKSQADGLNQFFLGEDGAIENLGSYERAILGKIQTDNAAKLAEYQGKVAFWSKKKNEYDSYLLKLDQVSHDYLMTEGAFEESSASYLIAERQRILNVFSGDNVNIF